MFIAAIVVYLYSVFHLHLSQQSHSIAIYKNCNVNIFWRLHFPLNTVKSQSEGQFSSADLYDFLLKHCLKLVLVSVRQTMACCIDYIFFLLPVLFLSFSFFFFPIESLRLRLTRLVYFLLSSRHTCLKISYNY